MIYTNLEEFKELHGENPPEGANKYWNTSVVKLKKKKKPRELYYYGKVGVYCIREEPEELELSLEEGTVSTGRFTMENPYEKLVVKVGSELVIDGYLKLQVDSKIHGDIVLESNAVLEIEAGKVMTMYPDSSLIIEEGALLVIQSGGALDVYGKINISNDLADFILNHENIRIDSIAVLEVDDIPLTDREYSLTDYEKDLRNRYINQYTQGEHNSGVSKIGYTWVGGSTVNSSTVIDLGVLWGNAVLGDYKLRCLGVQRKLVDGIQVVRNMKILKGATLNVTNRFEIEINNEIIAYDYLHPELYFGIVIDNVSTPADCLVEGTLVANGNGCTITFDRGATLHIAEGGVVDIRNGANLRFTYLREWDGIEENKETVLFIDGTLYLDTIEQLSIVYPWNVRFGENGKVVIRNKYDDGNHILFSTPSELNEDKVDEECVDTLELYKIFRDQIDHVEYHIPSNCGIKIDKYYEFYPSEMTRWFGGRRFEQALKDGILKWKGGFIELDSEIIPWVSEETTLLDIAKLFKNSAITDKDRLQEVVNHMMYCNSGDIAFHLRYNGEVRKVLVLRINKPTVQVAINIPGTDRYQVLIDKDNYEGYLFTRNEITSSNIKNLLNSKASVFRVTPSTETSTDIELQIV